MNKTRYNRISIALDELGLDQKDLSKAMDVTKDTVSRWCRNENQPRIVELYKIARLLKIDVFRLLEPTDWHNEPGPSPIEALKAEKEKIKQRPYPKKAASHAKRKA